MQFTKEQITEFLTEYNKTIKSLEEKFDIVLKLGKLTYYSQDGIASAKLTLKNNVVNGLSFEQNNWNTNCRSYGLKEEWFEKTIVFKEKRYKVIGLSSTKRDKVVELRDADSKTYWCTPQMIIKFYANLIEL